MKGTKKILPAIALLLLLASCGDGASDTVSTQAVTNAQTDGIITETAEADPTAIYDPQLEAVDFGGDVFNIIYGDNDFEPNLDVCADSTNGEPLNDAIFKVLHGNLWRSPAFIHVPLYNEPLAAWIDTGTGKWHMRCPLPVWQSLPRRPSL